MVGNSWVGDTVNLNWSEEGIFDLQIDRLEVYAENIDTIGYVISTASIYGKGVPSFAITGVSVQNVPPLPLLSNIGLAILITMLLLSVVVIYRIRRSSAS